MDKLSLADRDPTLAGENLTSTEHVDPGASTAPVQSSAPISNAAASVPLNETADTAMGAVPSLASEKLRGELVVPTA